jgi:hypothetical protein
MAYGNVYVDGVQSSTAGTPPLFYDGNSTQIGTLCRAWVNFNSTGAIRASFNVSSITVVSTGTYTVNFATAMSDTNYNLVGMSTLNQASIGGVIALGASSVGVPNTLTTGAVGVITTNAATGAPASLPYNYISVFR